MKKWIVKQYISLAEAFDWKIPACIRHLVPKETFSALLEEEQSLTRSLSQPAPDEPEVPANLEFLIESRIHASARSTQRRRRMVDYLMPLTAVAALVLLGIFLVDNWSLQEPALTPEPSLAQVEAVVVSVVETPGRTLSGIASLSEKGESLLVRPLASEKARLASDVSSALRYVARGIVPNQYMDKVNSQLDSFEQEYGHSG
ncbi:MAG: hypothetical protein ACO3ZW_08105 [Opitutales bacterium]|jgi:hypothetical protein